jgi:hypothetical protein
VINEIRFSARLKFSTEEKSGPPLFSPQDRIAKQHSNVLTVQRWSLGQQRRPQEKKSEVQVGTRRSLLSPSGQSELEKQPFRTGRQKQNRKDRKI